MVAFAQKEKIYTVEEYLALEATSEQKLEFHNGKIIQMAGGTIPHNTIKKNIIVALDNWITQNELDYLVLDSDTKIRIEKYNKFVYPDAILICEQPKYYKHRKDAIVNPVLIVEVLSKSTKKYDEEDKFKLYRTVSTFKEYLLVSQHLPQVVSYFKEDENRQLWKISEAEGLDDAIKLNTVDFDLPLNAIYRRIPQLLGEEWKG